jgi:hypothetical protein
MLLLATDSYIFLEKKSKIIIFFTENKTKQKIAIIIIIINTNINTRAHLDVIFAITTNNNLNEF